MAATFVVLGDRRSLTFFKLSCHLAMTNLAVQVYIGWFCLLFKLYCGFSLCFSITLDLVTWFAWEATNSFSVDQMKLMLAGT